MYSQGPSGHSSAVCYGTSEAPRAAPSSAGMPQQPRSQPLEGWLSKRGEDIGQAWMMRWCTLSLATGTLSISQQEHGSPERELQITPAMKVRTFDDPACSAEGKVQRFRKPMGFEICGGPGCRVWYFDAGTLIKRELWVRSLLQVAGSAHSMMY